MRKMPLNNGEVDYKFVFEKAARGGCLFVYVSFNHGKGATH